MAGKPETGDSGRVSPTAPRSKSIGEQQWATALGDRRFTKALKAGHADVDAGRVAPWAEVKKRLGL